MCVLRLSKALEFKEKRAVVVEAILSEIKSAVASNGKPYIDAILMDGRERVSFRHWDIDKQDFEQKYKLSSDKRFFLVQVNGQLDFFNDVPQIICKGGVVLVEREGGMDNYIDIAPYPETHMFTIINNEMGKIENEFLKEAYQKITEDISSKMTYYPYSSCVHSEKSGWLHHIYNCLGFASTGFGEPKKKMVEKEEVYYKSLLDKDVIKTSIVFYNTFLPFANDVDKETGIIIDYKKEDIIINENRMRNVVRAYDILDSYTADDVKTQNKIRNIKHCISCLNYFAEPQTPEAFYVTHLVNMELSSYKSASLCESIGYNETIKFSLNGSKHSVTRMY